MAIIEVISYQPMREAIEDGTVTWVPNKLAPAISKLPQIFWNSGEPWNEVNHWALIKASNPSGCDIQTVMSLMKHLAAYASWLESEKLDWRHFPSRMSERTIFKYRGEIIKQRDRGSLAASTTKSRMAAIIQFYRHAQINGFVQRHTPLWTDSEVVVRYYDPEGFERTLKRASTDLSIPNRSRPGLRLEDGLMPLRTEDAAMLMRFSKEQGSEETHLILTLGFLTGARISTIRSLGVKDIENAFPDVQIPGIYRIRVGPGTGVKTKFDVVGELMVPHFLIDSLKSYAYSMQRLRRQAKAQASDRGLLFLTTRGNPYRPGSFNRLMTDLRRRAARAGLRFMASFIFHQTRATFGTWLMKTALGVASAKAAVTFVKDAMLHKNERTTFLYIKFIEKEPIKREMANEFTTAFSGVARRDWNQYDA